METRRGFVRLGGDAMRRDLDLVRAILLDVEDAAGAVPLSALSYDGKTPAEIGHHVELMAHHGLLDATVTRDWGGDVVGGSIKAMTWDGCDYLDAVRSPKVWSETKRSVRDAVGETTLSVVRRCAEAIALRMVEASLGA